MPGLLPPPSHVVLEVLWTASNSMQQHELGQPLYPQHEIATRIKAEKTLQGQ